MQTSTSDSRYTLHLHIRPPASVASRVNHAHADVHPAPCRFTQPLHIRSPCRSTHTHTHTHTTHALIHQRPSLHTHTHTHKRARTCNIRHIRRLLAHSSKTCRATTRTRSNSNGNSDAAVASQTWLSDSAACRGAWQPTPHSNKLRPEDGCARAIAGCTGIRSLDS